MNRNDGARGDARKRDVSMSLSNGQARESARLEAGDVEALYETPADAEYPDVLHDDVPARVDWWWTAEGRARVIADAKAEALREAAREWHDAGWWGEFDDWLRDRAAHIEATR